MADLTALKALGYTSRWQALFEPYGARGLTPARAIRGDRGSLLIATPERVVHAKVSARLAKAASTALDLPAVGDWVAVLVAANKMDALDDPDRLASLERHLQSAGVPLYPVSAATGAGLDALLEAVWREVAQSRDEGRPISALE